MIRQCTTATIAALLAAVWSCTPLAAKDQPSDLPLLVEENFDGGSARWEPTDSRAWRVIATDAGRMYEQFRQSNYEPPHRSPLNISLLRDVYVGDFVLMARLRSTARDYDHRDMCVFFGHQDPVHFYYVHLGKKTDDHANQIFIVDGAPRTKISTTTTPGTDWDDEWHDVKIVRRTGDGTIEVFLDDMDEPIMTASDTTFSTGRIGVGSFDDTGRWDDIKLYGNRTEPPQ